MRKLLCLVVLLEISCSDSQGGGLDYDPNADKPKIVNPDSTDPGKAESACYPAFEDDELNVVTWNIQGLDVNSNTFNGAGTDLAKVQEIVESLDADIIAVQEIYSISSFTTLGNNLEGYSAFAMDIGGSLDIGYLIKTGSFSTVGDLFIAVDTSPRETIGITVEHTSGLEVTLLNIHLKCCGESSDISSRTTASNAIKTYIDTDLSDKAVILLGDYNDELDDGPFDNFLDDPSNYRFADIGVSDGSYICSSSGSFCGSDLDHILITNELFGFVGGVRTLLVDECVAAYREDVSDHRPVLASFK